MELIMILSINISYCYWIDNFRYKWLIYIHILLFKYCFHTKIRGRLTKPEIQNKNLEWTIGKCPSVDWDAKDSIITHRPAS